ncbi:hypothetical protein SAMN05216304_1021000 [Bosea sp. OK403]|uniref:hypothetical protein n=1 Tax=Bosea sp. OK403 TaxID=1855286 RepID=UPI0008E652BF|nr:hypothetical protein [Bosea sp. OK403]SFI49299.1 hypothetical protein SAMN05216304_1021000 [Bosea sp. OK403]
MTSLQASDMAHPASARATSAPGDSNDHPAALVASAAGGRVLPNGLVRPLESRDLEQVATLFLKTFRRKRKASQAQSAIEEAAGYMRQLYLEGPGSEGGAGSLVRVDAQGDIVGFLGILKNSYTLDGQALSAGVISTLMAADEHVAGPVGPQLVRALNQSPFDLVFADSANRASLALSRPLKYELLPLNCLEWACVFRPSALLVHKMQQKWPLTPAAILAPMAHVADFAAGRVLRSRRKRSAPGRWQDEAIDAAAFAEIAPTFLDAFRLRPVWARPELDWLLGQAAQRRNSGPLNFRVVRDGSDAPIGCYAFYAEKHGVARVLQVLARDGRWGAVIDCLRQTTEEMGCIGVHGAAQPSMMPHLYAHPGLFFYYAGGTMVRSANKDVIQAVRDNRALIGGLAGDRWTRLGTDEFGSA